MIQHLSELMLFLNYCLSQVVQKHYLGVVGNYSICWLLTFSVTCVPNIMKIRECFLKLQVKIAGMFFWDTVYINLPIIVAHQQCITSKICVFKSIDYTISLHLWLTYISLLFTRIYPMQPIWTWIHINRLLINEQKLNEWILQNKDMYFL